MRVYTAMVGPKDGEWFPVEVSEVPGVFTQGRDLVEVKEWSREAVALMTDTPTTELAIRADLPDSLRPLSVLH